MKRHITLMVEDFNEEKINRLKDYCNENDLDFKYRYGRESAWKDYIGEGIAPLYYFTIFGDTDDFNGLNKAFEGQIILTDFAEICNVANKDDDFEEEFKHLIEMLKQGQSASLRANECLLRFIMPIKNVNLLNEIKHYSGYMSDFQKQMIDDRILIVSGQQEIVNEEFMDNMLSLHNDVKELREKTGMNRKEFAKYFEIPYRTLEDWENKKSTCSTYLFKLMVKDLERNGFLKEIKED